MSSAAENLEKAVAAVQAATGCTDNQARSVVHSIGAFIMRSYAEELAR